jgi:hypothetical protein
MSLCFFVLSIWFTGSPYPGVSVAHQHRWELFFVFVFLLCFFFLENPVCISTDGVELCTLAWACLHTMAMD